MKDFTPDQTLPEVTEATHLYVLCEGLFNMNNSTLASYNMSSQLLEKNLFLSVNQRGLGDTANDMVLHGDNLFIVVDVSSQIEVIDARTGLSRKQIPLFNEQGIGRQPRTLVFHGGKGYLTCFDGHVLRIDTVSLVIDCICSVV